MKEIFKSTTAVKVAAILVLLALGVLLLLAPMETLTLYIRVIGAVLLAGAAVGFLVFFRTPVQNRSAAVLIGAIFAAVAGLVFAAAPGAVTGALPFVFGAMLLLASASELFSALALPFGKLIGIILSLIGVILGLIILMNPNAIAAFVTRLIGLSFLYEAAVGIVTALLARRALR